MEVRIGRSGSRRAFVWVISLVLLTTRANATTLYHLKVNGNASVPMRLVFALTCPDSGANVLTVLNANYDGSGQATGLVGGPISGALLRATSPADTTVVMGGSFYSELVYLLQSYTHFDCDLSITEQGPQSSGVLSQAALYYGIQDNLPSGVTTDPAGAQTLATIDINGSPGGELSVYSPLSFVAPDTLLFNAALVDVPREGPGVARLRFAPIMPNPGRGRTLFSFDFPRSGMARLRIYDVAGRVVAEPLNGTQVAGHRDVSWLGADRGGSRIAPGVYLAELRWENQTVVRRFVLTR